MRRIAYPGVSLLLCVLLLPLAGCQPAQTVGVSVLNLIGLAEKPLVVMHAAERTGAAEGPLEVLDPFAPYARLDHAMSKSVKRTVVPDMSCGFQVEPNLGWGLCHV